MKILYGDDFDDRAIAEAASRGVVDDVIVDFGKRQYKISIYNYKRLQLEIDLMIDSCDQFLMWTDCVVLKGDLTKENIEFSIKKLSSGGYFDLLTPISMK